MPFEIVRNDIVNMQADALVNTVNPNPVIGFGVDSAIYEKAGAELLKAREKMGKIAFGEAQMTPAFGLNAKYIIHTVGPVWKGGHDNEEEILASCYRKSLKLAREKGCESIAFPLIATGNYGFPKALALQIAMREISSFLLEYDMQVSLVVFEKEAFMLSEKLFKSVSSYIDENYVRSKAFDEYKISLGGLVRGVFGGFVDTGIGMSSLRDEFKFDKKSGKKFEKKLKTDFDDFTLQSCEKKLSSDYQEPLMLYNQDLSIDSDDLGKMLKNLDAGFSQTLLTLIDRTGKKDSEIYKKANVDRKLFSKIRNNPDYKPSKSTALAFAFALELDVHETKDFIARAGFALSHSNKFDVIVEYFLVNKNHDVFELNQVLFAFDQPLIGT